MERHIKKRDVELLNSAFFIDTIDKNHKQLNGKTTYKFFCDY